MKSVYVYETTGKKWEWRVRGTDGAYWATNDSGDGVFYVDSENNERRQLAGTCDFSVNGVKDPRAKIRAWMKKYYAWMEEV